MTKYVGKNVTLKFQAIAEKTAKVLGDVGQLTSDDSTSENDVNESSKQMIHPTVTTLVFAKK